MFTGGTNTSSNVMDWVMAELIRNPGMMEKAQKEVRMAFNGKGQKPDEKDIGELSYLKSGVKETLRLQPLPLLLPRQCTKKCEINGYEIPLETRILINGWAIGRDPESWDDSETFKPKRFVGIRTIRFQWD